ncbi:MAG: MTAP family purine nucleoside phosphorylase [Syntrophales bacterium]|jgi:5'-methylthioadenosine phosphorylase|nr:MTAP family purine nucleoside phosphorylase [Syntrophales bacterium]
MKTVGIISGTVLLNGQGIFSDLREEAVETEFGRAVVFHSANVFFIARHGSDPNFHILPHLINHQANLAALKKLGATEVIGVNSTGALKRRLKPGTLVVPDDYIQLGAGITAVRGEPVHITPRLNQEVRQKLHQAAHECAINPVDGGIYWQSAGPRLETRAEIAMISQFADIIGMTMASEAIIAQELDISYASLCSVDNYAHGIEKRELTLQKILQHARLNSEAIHRILNCYVEQNSRRNL